jgi:hypothetical protein
MSNTNIFDDNERTRLIVLLEKTAKRYFNKDESLAIGCGICFVIKEYDLMSSLMEDMGEPEYGFDVYHDTWEEWEPRAWMCLFLVAYLKDETAMGKMTESSYQPTELELHRMDNEAIREAGFESPGELLAAYNTLKEKVCKTC